MLGDGRRGQSQCLAQRLLDNLEITVAKFLIPIFHPETSLIDDIGQFLGIVRQKRGGFNRECGGDDAIVKTDIWTTLYW